MQIRDLIRGGIRPSATATSATLATDGTPPSRSVAKVATVAVADGPEGWLEYLRAGDLPGLSSERWERAADALAALVKSGAVAKALELAWEAHELVGVRRQPPHDGAHVAGLIFSMLPGDTVTDVRRSGCLITYQGGRHVWLRRPLTLDTCLPWDLPA